MEKVRGPATYFPSIEKKDGRPVGEWPELIRQSRLERHMDTVNWLKMEYGFGHRHANALVGYVSRRATSLATSSVTQGSDQAPAALRRTILEIVPDGDQVISYKVPAFCIDGRIVAGFAAFKDHLSYLPFSGSALPEPRASSRGTR